ncbi:hypothetical protein [Shimia sp.]|uniref:hypothetical protein n=1 Tax=Shimia sp. TaxID=1954381 RepID=UPI003BA98F3E
MAVVTAKSDLFRDTHGGGSLIDPLISKGRIIVATGIATNASTDENGSSYRLVELPSDCILVSGTFFDVQNWGFAQVVIGTKTDTDALVDQGRTSENIVTPIVDGDANHKLRLWETLGLSEDPGGVIALFAHAEANATGAGNMPFRIHYLYN